MLGLNVVAEVAEQCGEGLVELCRQRKHRGRWVADFGADHVESCLHDTEVSVS